MDTIDLFKCEWPVHKDGYLIKDSKIIPVSDGVDMYNPFNFSALFYDFANLKQSGVPVDASISDDALIEFANQYGLLFQYDNTMQWWENKNDIQTWRYHIIFMEFAIKLWKSGHKKRAIEYPESYMTLQPKFDPGTFNLHLWPDSLLSALYMQLGLAVGGNKNYRPCAWCGATFEISPRNARTNRLFCSNACKQAEYRNRTKGK